MRARRTVRLLLLALAIYAIAAVSAVSAAAALAPSRTQPLRTTVVPPAPAAVVVKTAAVLPGASYPWVYPVWTGTGVVTRLGTTASLGDAPVQPPAWIPIA